MALAVCPKCGAAQEPGNLRACEKCGLAADRMEGFAIERDAMVPEVLVAAWDRAVASWEDQKLHDEVIMILATPEMKSRIKTLGFDVIASTPQNFAKQLQEDLDRWGLVAKAAVEEKK